MCIERLSGALPPEVEGMPMGGWHLKEATELSGCEPIRKRLKTWQWRGVLPG